MIEVQNLVKKYGDNYAVDDISFSVRDGEIVGFLGPNGAGKTTTMNIITGYLSPTSGKVLMDGIDIMDKPIEVKKNIGFLPETPPLYLDMTVREYLYFICDLKKVKFPKKPHIDEILKLVKIDHVQNRLIKCHRRLYKIQFISR